MPPARASPASCATRVYDTGPLDQTVVGPALRAEPNEGPQAGFPDGEDGVVEGVEHLTGRADGRQVVVESAMANTHADSRDQHQTAERGRLALGFPISEEHDDGQGVHVDGVDLKAAP